MARTLRPAGDPEEARLDRAKRRRAGVRLWVARCTNANSLAPLNSLGDWLLDQKLRVLPKRPLGQAISYALANWRALCRYPEDGDLSIDNNLSERALRAQSVGRKNWLFVDSDNGGRTAAVLFSMTASCKRHGIDPFRYLADVLRRLPATPPDQLTQLLPDIWFQAYPHAARKQAA